MKEIIITGASGFVGKNLTDYLKRHDFNVNAVSLRDSWESKITSDSDAIIHLAGKAHDTKNSSDPSEYFEVNTELTKRLFDFFLKSEITYFVHFSSVKAIADEVDGVLDEETLPNPATPYGKSKFLAEQYILNAELPGDKKIFIIRPCMIHGPFNKGNLNLLYNIVKKGIPYPLGKYDNKRSFLSIDNLCFVLERILEGNVTPGTYQLADTEPLSTNELIRLIGESRGTNPLILKISPALINGLAKLGNVLKLPLNTERLKKLTENYIVSNDKIVSAIGEPLPVTAKEGLLKTLNSFK